MSHLETIQKMGASVRLSIGGKLKLSGAGEQDAVVQYVREHKDSIIRELKTSVLPNPDLPPSCPFNTGGHCPMGCRFTTDLLCKLIRDGLMPDSDAGCMFKNVCGES